MIRTLLRHGCAIASGIFLVAAPQVKAVTIGFSSSNNSSITFDGTADTFQFLGGFEVDLSNGVGDAVGLSGNLGGIFTIGAITAVGTPFGTLEAASVTGPGTFSITDVSSTSLTADVSWLDIYTLGTGGDLNSGGQINLTNIQYLG